MVAVFAVGDVHLSVCPDGAFEKGATHVYPEGNSIGQYGWDIGVNYKSVPDLFSQLLATEYRSINRLALSEHGSPGGFALRGAELTLASIETDDIKNTLRSLNGFLAPGATLLLMACNSGAGDAGTQFLTGLSRFFPGRKVVGFTTVGLQFAQYRRGEKCTNPGMRDTDNDNPSSGGSQEDQRYGDGKYLRLPWASEQSTHAKVALDGKIIRGPIEATGGPADSSADAYLPGTWSVTIGDWRGYFFFKKTREAAWQDDPPTRRHTGKWWARDGSVYWSYDDDTPGWQRLFEVAGPLKSTVQGSATVKGVPHGFFTMSKQD